MLAQAFCQAGHEVVWWSSTFNHQLRKQRFNSSVTIIPYENLKIRLLHGPGYKKSVSYGRLRHNKIVANRFFSELSGASETAKPDVVYCCLPTLELCEQVMYFSLRNCIPYVIDIRDQWPSVYLTIVPPLFHGPAKILLSREFSRARRILANAEAILAVSAANLMWGLELANRQASGFDRCFPLGYLGEHNSNESPGACGLGAEHIRRIADEKAVVITFIGSFSEAYDLKNVCRAARQLNSTNEANVMFIMVGSGEQEKKLRSNFSNIPNLVFTGWLDQKSISWILNHTSVGICPYNSKRPITLPNKPFEYMAAGLPILSSLEGEFRTLLENKSIGLHYKLGEDSDLTEKILWILSHPRELEKMGENAKKVFKTDYDAKRIYPDLVRHVVNLVEKRFSRCGSRCRPEAEIRMTY
jgi:glycosyltransferase involved in cell wall biosynthesis